MKNEQTIKTRKAKNKTNYASVLAELRGRYKNLSEVIMELVDNASSDFEAHCTEDFHGMIDVEINKLKNASLRVTVRDNGFGIVDLDKALAIGNKAGAQTATNDHAQGFKNLPVEKIYLRTATESGYYRVDGPFYEGVEIQECEPFEDLKRGTEFVFEIGMPYFKPSTVRWGESSGAGNCTKFFSIIDCIVDDIGMVHGFRMKELGYEIRVTADDGQEQQTYNVEPILPVVTPYDATDPALGTPKKAEGVCKIPAFDGNGTITMEYSFGEVSPNIPSRKGYFEKKLATQGLYFYQNGRYIGKTDSFGDRAAHPSKNGHVGIIKLHIQKASQAPQTEIAKTGYVKSSLQYIKLVETANALVPNLASILARKAREKVTEVDVTRALTAKMVENGDIAEHQVQVPGDSKAKADIVNYTKKEIYEFKLKPAAVGDAFQLLGYIAAWMDENDGKTPFRKAYLCTTDLPDEAREDMKHANYILKQISNIQIEYRNLYEFTGNNEKILGKAA